MIDLSSKFILKPASEELTVQYVAGEMPLGQSFGGLQAFSDRFVRGYGNKVFGSDSNGIWLGAADFSLAPFKVDMTGKVTMTEANITGYATNANVVTIIGNTVNATFVNALNVQAATVKSDWVYAGNISADQIITGSMSADRITSGSMSASRISGGTLTLGGNNNGNGVMYLNNSSGQNAVLLDRGGIVFWDDRAENYLIWGTSGGLVHGFLGFGSDSFTVGSDEGKDMYIASDGHLNLNASNSGKDVTVSAGRNINLNPGTSCYISCGKDIGMNDHNINGATTIWAFNFSNRSDIRLKKNVEDLDVDIDDLFRLIPVTFNYKKEEDDSKKHTGFIAQEVEQVFPNLVTVDEDGIKAINYNEMVALLFAMTKKLAEKVYGPKKASIERADASKLPELVEKKPEAIKLFNRNNLKVKIRKAK